MGIYIKGMTMPEYCAKCPMCHRNFDGEETRLACYALKAYCIGGEEDRSPNCPLVEIKTPHGRLIDADELINDLRHDVTIDQDMLDYEELSELNRINIQGDKDIKQNAIDMLEHSQTVIEAEGEG